VKNREVGKDATILLRTIATTTIHVAVTYSYFINLVNSLHCPDERRNEANNNNSQSCLLWKQFSQSESGHDNTSAHMIVTVSTVYA